MAEELTAWLNNEHEQLTTRGSMPIATRNQCRLRRLLPLGVACRKAFFRTRVCDVGFAPKDNNPGVYKHPRPKLMFMCS
jgi:hypothetical protein